MPGHGAKGTSNKRGGCSKKLREAASLEGDQYGCPTWHNVGNECTYLA